MASDHKIEFHNIETHVFQKVKGFYKNFHKIESLFHKIESLFHKIESLFHKNERFKRP
jgi:hypothetical protein